MERPGSWSEFQELVLRELNGALGIHCGLSVFGGQYIQLQRKNIVECLSRILECRI